MIWLNFFMIIEQTLNKGAPLTYRKGLNNFQDQLSTYRLTYFIAHINYHVKTGYFWSYEIMFFYRKHLHLHMARASFVKIIKRYALVEASRYILYNGNALEVWQYCAWQILFFFHVSFLNHHYQDQLKYWMSCFIFH